MKRILAACVLLMAGAWASGQINGQGGVYINGVLQGGGGSIYSYLWSGGISMLAPTTDVAPDPLLLRAANAWPGAATNAVGANTILAGGIGKRIYTIVDYTGLGASTVTVTVNGTATVLTEPTHWSAATSNNATATSLAAAIEAVAGVGATASSAVVRIVPDAATFSVELAKSAADSKITLAMGDGGLIRLPRVDGYGPSSCYIYSYGGSLLNLGSAPGGSDTAIGVGGINLSTGNILFRRTAGDQQIGWLNSGGTGYDLMLRKESGTNLLGLYDEINAKYTGIQLDTNITQYADTVTLTDTVKTAVVDIAIADAEFIGGTISYTVTATDTTNHQALTGIVGFSGVRKAAAYSLTIAESASPVLAESAGASTLVDTWAIDAGTNVATISVTADSSLTTPTMTVRYQLTLNSANAVTKK
jgi:hypothetical protein